jgi:hypothetical protein
MINKVYDPIYYPIIFNFKSHPIRMVAIPYLSWYIYRRLRIGFDFPSPGYFYWVGIQLVLPNLSLRIAE